MAVLNRNVAGIPSTTGLRIATHCGTTSTARIKAGTDTGLTTGVVWGAAGTPDAIGNFQLQIDGLNSNTLYYYRIAMTDSGTGVEALDNWAIGHFKTDTSATNFTIGFGACCNNLDSTAFGALAAKNPDLFFHLGDEYYYDGSGTGIDNFRAKMDQRKKATNQKAIYRTSGTCLVPSDHDGMNNNTNNGADSTAWTNYNTAYREFNPTDGIPATKGVWRSFKRGRVRFLAIERRSFATAPSATDNSSKTCLGATQKQWLKDQITAATEPVILILNPDPWIGGAQSGDDGWFGYITERNELASFFSASGKNICMVAGDMHALAAEDGSSSPGGVAIFHAAPFDNNSSIKGGPYDVGPWPSSGTSVVQDYGWIDVTDTGTTISFAYRGFSADNTQRVALTKTYAVAGNNAFSGSVALSGSGSRSLSGTATFSGVGAIALSCSAVLTPVRAPQANLITASGFGTLALVPGMSVMLTPERLAAFRNGTNGNLVVLVLDTAGRMALLDYNGATIPNSAAAGAFPQGAWVRVELAATVGSTPTNGRVEYAYYLGDSPTPLGTYDSGPAVDTGGETVTSARIGRDVAGTVARALYYDDIQGEPRASGWIGPSRVTPSATLALSASGTLARAGTPMSIFNPERIAAFRNGTDGNLMVLILDPGGKLAVQEHNGVTLVDSVSGASFPADEWVRVEMAATIGTTPTNGRIEYAYYLGDSLIPVGAYDSDLTVDTGGETVTSARLGRDLAGNFARALYFDDIRAEGRVSGWAGPSRTTPTGSVTLSGSGALTRAAAMAISNARALSGAGSTILAGGRITGGSIAQAATGTLTGAGGTMRVRGSVAPAASGTLGLEHLKDFAGAFELSATGTLALNPGARSISDVLLLTAAGNFTSLVQSLYFQRAISFSAAGVLDRGNVLAKLRGALAVSAGTGMSGVSHGVSHGGGLFPGAVGSMSRAASSGQQSSCALSGAGALSLQPTRLTQIFELNSSATGTQARAVTAGGRGTVALTAVGALSIAGSSPRATTTLQTGATGTLTGDAVVAVSGARGLAAEGFIYRIPAGGTNVGWTPPFEALCALTFSRVPGMKQALGRDGSGLLTTVNTRQTVRTIMGASASGALSLTGAVVGKFRLTSAGALALTAGALAAGRTLNLSATGRIAGVGGVKVGLELYTNSGVLTLSLKKVAHSGAVSLSGSGTQTRPSNSFQPKQTLRRTMDGAVTSGTIVATKGRVARTGSGGLARLLDSMTVDQLLSLAARSGQDWTFLPEENAGAVGFDVYGDLRLRWRRGRMKGKIMPSPYHAEMSSARRRVTS